MASSSISASAYRNTFPTFEELLAPIPYRISLNRSDRSLRELHNKPASFEHAIRGMGYELAFMSAMLYNFDCYPEYELSDHIYSIDRNIRATYASLEKLMNEMYAKVAIMGNYVCNNHDIPLVDNLPLTPLFERRNLGYRDRRYWPRNPEDTLKQPELDDSMDEDVVEIDSSDADNDESTEDDSETDDEVKTTEVEVYGNNAEIDDNEVESNSIGIETDEEDEYEIDEYEISEIPYEEEFLESDSEVYNSILIKESSPILFAYHCGQLKRKRILYRPDGLENIDLNSHDIDFNGKNLADILDSTSTCSICMETKTNIKFLFSNACCHCFCSSCMNTLFKDKFAVRCPNCRKIMHEKSMMVAFENDQIEYVFKPAF